MAGAVATRPRSDSRGRGVTTSLCKQVEYRATGDRVYQAIKTRVIACEFPPGERIYLEPIAEALGVSTTPVREAMNRLAERDLVIKAANKGFYAMTLSEARLTGHYELTRLLLTLGLETLPLEVQRRFPLYAPIAEVLNKLNRRVITDPGTLARYTAGTFQALAALTDNSAVQLAIDRANDHLHFVRMLESRHLDDVQGDLKHICELLLSGRRDELVAAINAYHGQRLALLPILLRDLRR